MDRRKIEIRFFDPDLKFIGEEDAYQGLEFITRWTKYGTFQIFVDKLTKQMKVGNYIMLDNDRRKTGIIKRITYPTAGLAYHSFYEPAENIICELVTANAVDASDKSRNIPMLSVKSSKGRGDRVYFQTRYNNLDEEITSLCEASGLGVCITLNPEAQKLEFEVLEGVDRSANQKDRPPMVFSIDYDNVISREYVSDVSEFKNTAIVAGQGEGADRKITLVGNENTGINRYEMFVDARDIEDESALPDRGKNKLADYTCSDTYSSEVDSAEYQTKWNLGDVVVTIDHEYGVNMNERIVEVTETFDENGYTVAPTFGTIQKTIMEKAQTSTSSSGQATVEGIRGADGKTPRMMINSDGHLIAIYED